MANAAPRLLTRPELAAAFDVHPLTVTKWEAAGLPITERGSRGRPSKYSLPAVVAWFIQRELQARNVGDGTRLDPLHERALLDRRRREMVEFDLQVKRGEFVPREEFLRVYETHVLQARNALRALPSRALDRLNLSRSAAAVLAEMIDQVLEELADRRTQEEVDGEHNGDAEGRQDHAGDQTLLAPTSSNGTRANGNGHAGPYPAHAGARAIGPGAARGVPSTPGPADRDPGRAPLVALTVTG